MCFVQNLTFIQELTSGVRLNVPTFSFQRLWTSTWMQRRRTWRRFRTKRWWSAQEVMINAQHRRPAEKCLGGPCISWPCRWMYQPGQSSRPWPSSKSTTFVDRQDEPGQAGEGQVAAGVAQNRLSTPKLVKRNVGFLDKVADPEDHTGRSNSDVYPADIFPCREGDN